MKINKIRLLGSFCNALAYISPNYATKLVWRIFCTPKNGGIKPHHTSFLSSAKYNVYKLQNIKIQAYKWGNGPRKVVFMHGWASNSFRWKKYIEMLSPDEFSVFAIDAPGHGFSTGSSPNLVLFKDSLALLLKDIGPVETIIGHSIGGFATTFLLSDAKTHIADQAIIMASPGEVEDFFTFFNKLLGLNTKLQTHFKLYFKQKIGYDPSFFSASKFAETIDIPCLIIHDVEDMDAAYQNALILKSKWKKAALHTTTGLGHHLRDDSIYHLVKSRVLSFG